MFVYIAYGILLTIGYHIGGKISKRLGLCPKDEKKVKIYRGSAINTESHVSKLEGGRLYGG